MGELLYLHLVLIIMTSLTTISYEREGNGRAAVFYSIQLELESIGVRLRVMDYSAGKIVYCYLTCVLLAQQALSICIPPNHCIEDMEYSDAKQRYAYVLSKYAELKMKISGEPLGLHGKLVTHGDVEEQHIVFQLMDNTPHDVIQSCVFMVSKAPGECESIETVCNAFHGRTPRPLLERKPLIVCEDGVREAEAEMEVEVEPETEPAAEDTDDANEGKEATAATSTQDIDVTNDTELI